MKLTRAMIISLLAMVVGLGGCLTVSFPETEAPSSAAPAPTPTPNPAPPPEPLPIPKSAPAPAPEPVHPTTPAPVTPQPPHTQQQLSWQDVRDQIRVIEFPKEAYVGEYITIKVQVLGEDLRAQMMSSKDKQIREWLWYMENGMYELVLCKEYFGVSYEPSLGTTTPDDDIIVCWYAAIPTRGASYELNNEGKYEWHEGPFPPGNYKMELRVLDPCDNSPGYYCGWDILLERNIIIKD